MSRIKTKNEKQSRDEAGHYLVVVQEKGAAPGEYYEQYFVPHCSDHEDAEAVHYSRMLKGDFPKGCTAYIYACSLVSMMGDQYACASAN